MFSLEKLSFKKLCTLEKDSYLKRMLDIYKCDDENTKMFEIFVKQESVGILIAIISKDDFYIDYFQIFKSKRLQGVGKSFIINIINDLRENGKKFKSISLTPLEESIPFWNKCGFVIDEQRNDTMYYKL